MNKAIITLCLLALAAATPLIRTDGGKVKIDFYYESLCPYCQQFMERSLKIAASTKVRLTLFRISGKFVISTFIPTATPEELRMELAGVSHVNMV